ncbi:hypothetical protein Tco_1406724 [Tanacetum coccineum]
MTTSKLPSLIGMRSILKDWFNKIIVQPWITVLVPTSFPSAISMSVASSGWPFVSVVPGQMTYLVASLTLDSARSCVMQGGIFLQVVVVGEGSSIIKISFVIIDFLQIKSLKAVTIPSIFWDSPDEDFS